MMIEIWKNIKGYEGMYQVSNLGNVKSLERNRIGKGNSLVIVPKKNIKPKKIKSGYLIVHLYKNGKGKYYYVHRLVWQAFKGDISEGYEVNHINEKKEENNLDNLNLMTHKENMNFGTRTERAGKAIAKANTNGKCSKPVLQYDLEGNFIKEFPSANEVERSLGFNNGNISKCCRGKFKTMYGYYWKYAS